MKLITYRRNGREAVGVLSPCMTRVTPISAFWLSYVSLNEVMEKATTDELSSLAAGAGIDGPATMPLDSVEVISVITVPE